MNILIVDDSESIVELLTLTLNNAGYKNIFSASSAKEAYSKIGMEKTATIQIDLILLDILMPEIDGLEACKKIKSSKEFSDIPIVMMTGHSEDHYQQTAFDNGAYDFIRKPPNKFEFLTRIRAALKLKQLTDEKKILEKKLSQWIAK